jgi:hypothetical protein
MNWFRQKPTQQKYIEAAVTVASNLYLHTMDGEIGGPAPLEFTLHDSRFRYLIFCLSTVLTTALVYDQKKDIQPEALFSGCLQFLTLVTTEHPDEYFDDPSIAQDSISRAAEYLQQFLKDWSSWPQLEAAGQNAQINEIISRMIRTTESNRPAETSDLLRLGKLALEIDCRMPTMRGALVELANRK